MSSGFFVSPTIICTAEYRGYVNGNKQVCIEDHAPTVMHAIIPNKNILVSEIGKGML